MDLLLAQDETATQTIGWLERILAGGVPLICLVIAAICGYAFYRQLTRNNTLETDFRGKVEALLREMLAGYKESQEAVAAAVQAVEAFQSALTEQQKACEEASRQIEALGRKVDRLEESIRRAGCGTRPGP